MFFIVILLGTSPCRVSRAGGAVFFNSPTWKEKLIEGRGCPFMPKTTVTVITKALWSFAEES